VTTRLVVLASGNGSNLQAIIDACETGSLNAQVVAVISDNSNAYALQRAASHNAACRVVNTTNTSRNEFNVQLAHTVNEFKPDIVVLAGFMRLLTLDFLTHFPNRVVNIHPALPGELPGTNAIARAFDEFTAGKRTHTGVMVHFVPNEGVDNGPVIDSAVVPIYPTDSLADLEQRMHATEHQLLITALIQLTKEHTP
jgi:phosphoribosylglycinamide formyltransferase-1